MAFRVILPAVMALLFSLAGPLAIAQSRYTLRVSADDEFQGELETCMRKALASHPELGESDAGFRYFISVIGMPIIHDESGETVGYAVSSLVVSPLEVDKIAGLMNPEAQPLAGPLLSRAHNLLNYKLYIVRRKNLQETCGRITETMAAAIATEEARRTSVEVKEWPPGIWTFVV